MKTTKFSTNKKIMTAASMLLLSTFMLSSATYAWFTMNRSVEVTGMEVRTKVSSNLLICTTNLDADYSANTLSQTRKALLEPASSINGATGTFYYTTDAKASGQKANATDTTPYIVYAENAATPVANATAGKNNYDSAFNSAYGLGDSGVFTAANITLDDSAARDGAGYGYIDYVFYLKATSDAANQAINMTQCDLDYNPSGTASAIDSGFAWRTAIFALDITDSKAGNGLYTTEDIATAENQKGLIAMANSVNWEANKAVASTTATGTVLNNGSSGVVLGTITAANTTKYYKVVVRLWLEGEDQSCNTKTYAALTDDYSLDLKFELGQGTAVSAISTNTFAANTTKTQIGNQTDAKS